MFTFRHPNDGHLLNGRGAEGRSRATSRASRLGTHWLRRLGAGGSLLLLMSLFIVGNLLCAIAPPYGFLMAARVVTAFCHAAFFGIAVVAAADLVPPSRRASAWSRGMR